MLILSNRNTPGQITFHGFTHHVEINTKNMDENFIELNVKGVEALRDALNGWLAQRTEGQGVVVGSIQTEDEDGE